MNSFNVEIGGERQKYLIVDPTGTAYTLELKKILKQYDADVYISPVAPPNTKRFAVCFFINESDKVIRGYSTSTDSKYIFIFLTNRKRAEKYADRFKKHAIQNSRVVYAPNKLPEPDEVEKMIWFVSTPSNEWLLTMHRYSYADEMPQKKKRSIITKPTFRKLHIAIFVMIAIFILHTIFIVPLARSSLFEYRSLQSLQKGDIKTVKSYLPKIESSLSLSNNLYSIVRPTYHFFSLAEFPDNIMQINESGLRVLKTSVPLVEEGASFASLLFQENEDVLDLEIVKRKQADLTRHVEELHKELSFLHVKIPGWNQDLKKHKAQMSDIIETLEITKKILPHLDEILAADGSKKYLLLFANNMELRPGGGFIGSFGILNVERFKIKTLTVYDVYDADGQLNAHIPPPEPIRQYMQQPHWFLRDSAFSPDNYENYLSAVKFLDREMGFKDFDGGVLITTSAIQTILGNVGPIYVSEFKESISKDNFYLKAQLYSEKDFFPGSIQKKSFLSSVADSLLLHLEDSPSIGALEGLLKALNEKQMAVYFEETELQDLSDSLYWTGKVISPRCTVTTSTCALDYLFAYDANLGVNKANFFVTKSESLHVTFDKEGNVDHKLRIIIRNNSPNEVFPGGVYKNYFQVLLPPTANITSITRNQKTVDRYDEILERYKKIGFYIEVPPSDITDIVIKYRQRNLIPEGKSVYQLVVQKQLGSPDYDFELSVKLPAPIYLLNKNFSALVKDNAILYNTSIKADKIFLIELLRNQ